MTIIWSFSNSSFVNSHCKKKLHGQHDSVTYPTSCYKEVLLYKMDCICLLDIQLLRYSDSCDQTVHTTRAGFKKIFKGYKRVGYNMDIMRKSAYLVVNPIIHNGWSGLRVNDCPDVKL